MAAEFWKVLSETDVKKRLSIPTEFFERHMLPRFELEGGSNNSACKLHKAEVMEMEVRDGKGQVWVLGCSVRRKGLYAKPVISRGWCNFVRAMGLRAGDMVAFSLQLHGSAQAQPRGRLNFQVAATRGIKLFGIQMNVPIL